MGDTLDGDNVLICLMLFLFSGGQVGWIGLQDFLSEGTFSWADLSSLGPYTNWANNQPDNAGQGQVRGRHEHHPGYN